MSVTVRIPTQLARSPGARRGPGRGGTVGEALKALDAAYPGFAGRLFDDTGELRRFVNVFLADEDVRFLDGPGLGGGRRPDRLDRPGRGRRLRPAPGAPAQPASRRSPAVAPAPPAWFAIGTR